MANEGNFSIRITTQGDPSGARAVTTSLQEAERAAEKAAQTTTSASGAATQALRTEAEALKQNALLRGTATGSGMGGAGLGGRGGSGSGLPPIVLPPPVILPPPAPPRVLPPAPGSTVPPIPGNPANGPGSQGADNWGRSAKAAREYRDAIKQVNTNLGQFNITQNGANAALRTSVTGYATNIRAMSSYNHMLLQVVGNTFSMGKATKDAATVMVAQHGRISSSASTHLGGAFAALKAQVAALQAQMAALGAAGAGAGAGLGAGAAGAGAQRSALDGLSRASRRYLQEQQKMKQGNNSLGQGLLNLSYIADDVQYGFRGIVNNIGPTLMAFGAGAGLTGVLATAAVGLYIVGSRFDWFGEEAKKAAKKTESLTKEVRAAANAEYGMERNEASKRKSLEFIENATKRYEDLKESIDKAAASQNKLNQLMLANVDAQAALDMAEIDARVAEGNMSEKDAVWERSKVTERVEGKKYEVAQDESKKRVQTLEQEAEAKSREIANLISENARLTSVSGGVKSNEWREKTTQEAARLDSVAEQYKNNNKKGGWDIDKKRMRAEAMTQAAQLRAQLGREMEFRLQAGLKDEGKGGIYDRDKSQMEKIRTEKKALDDLKQAKKLEATEIDYRKKDFELSKKTRQRVAGTETTKLVEQDSQEKEKERLERIKNEKKGKGADDTKFKTGITDISDKFAAFRKNREIAGIDDKTQSVTEYAKGKAGRRGRVGAGEGKSKADLMGQVTESVNALKDGIDAGEEENLVAAIKALVAALGPRDDAIRTALRAVWGEVNRLKNQVNKSR